MNFIVHDAAGNILRTGFCMDVQLPLQASAGETAIEDTWGGTSDVKHKIVAGERVDLPPRATPSNLTAINYRALIRRKADKLAAAGQQYEALLLLQTIGG